MARECVRVKFSTYRNVVKGKNSDGSDRRVKQHRRAVELAPNADAETVQDAVIGWAADMCEQGHARKAVAIIKAANVLPVGFGGTWKDVATAGAKISDTKASMYVLSHIMDEPFHSLAAAGKAASEEARQAARKAMETGVEATADDIDEETATLLDKARKEYYDRVEALPDSRD